MKRFIYYIAMVALSIAMLMLISCKDSGPPEPKYISVGATITEVYQEGGAFRVTKVWKTSVKLENGIHEVYSGKLGKKGDTIKVEVKNPKYRRR